MAKTPPAKRRLRTVDPVTAYAKAVTAGKIVAGMLVRLACLRHLRDLDEQDARGLVWKPDQAQIGIDFFEQVLCLPDEKEESSEDASDGNDSAAGKPFKLSPFQQFIVGSLDGWWKTDGHRRFRTAYIETAKGSGKALALDTPIPTPTGWTTMGELEVGATILDERGSATTVVYVAPVQYGNTCSRVMFSDGTSIVADDEHLWRVASGHVVTTAQLAAAATRHKADERALIECHEEGIPRPTGDHWGRRFEQVVSVVTVPSVPVRCIAVANNSHLFLAGKGRVPTHNTPMAAGMGLKALVLDKGIGKQIFTAAVTEKQAGLAFTDAERMVAASPHLRELLETSVGNIAHVPSGSFIRRISSEKRGLDGKRVHMALIDEVHEHPSGIVVEKMRAGTKNRLDALIFLITNSGYDRTSVCWDLHEYGRQILEGTIQNDQFFAYVCQLDPCEACYTKGVRIPSDACPDCDHWQDEGPHWLKANPNLGVSLSWSYLREQVQEAIGMPTKQNIVRRLNFCQWTEARSIWIPADEWDACEVPLISDGNPGKLPCAVGVDLSTKQDLSSACVALRYEDEASDEPAEAITIETPDETGAPVKRTLNLDFSVELIPFFWMPEDTLRERQRIDRIPFDVWKKDGHLRTTLGPVVDYDEIYDTLVGDIVKRYRVQEIGYDKWNATQFGTQLRDRAKLTAVEVTQGKFLSETAKLFHALVRSGRIRHAGNPVMNWCVANAEAKVDRFENIWLEKPSPRQRIDGVIAALIALHRLVSLPFRRPSVYKRRGALVWNPTTGFAPMDRDAARS